MFNKTQCSRWHAHSRHDACNQRQTTAVAKISHDNFGITLHAKSTYSVYTSFLISIQITQFSWGTKRLNCKQKYLFRMRCKHSTVIVLRLLCQLNDIGLTWTEWLFIILRYFKTVILNANTKRKLDTKSKNNWVFIGKRFSQVTPQVSPVFQHSDKNIVKL